MRPAIFDEISTVSPSMRPLTKSVPSGSALRLHPDRTSRTVPTIIQVRLIGSSMALLAVGFLGRSHSPRQVRARQPKQIPGPNLRVIGLCKPVLRVHHFGVVGYALRKP